MKYFLFRLSIVLIVGGLVFSILSGIDIIDNLKTPVNYQTMTIEDVKEGVMVEGNLFSNYGSYEEEYSTKNGVRTGSSRYYYMIDVGDQEYMGLYTGIKDLIAQLDRQTDETYDYLNGETEELPQPVHFKGKICKMTSEDEGYFNSMLREMGYTATEADMYGLKYYIEVISYEHQPVALAIGIVMLLAGVGMIVFRAIRKR